MVLTDEFFMRQALQEARLAAQEGEIPVGAIIACQGGHDAREGRRRDLAARDGKK